ncbi:putative UDP-glucuronate:xylan alpha-glucuronosyltransferase 3 [Hibiscus syriacus]|uniref:UDP-glucuronate:xylan alpha-glucuronosyltransferase 3 n=1 Tax=Hibiscus syriacus TaxID=106335 RepID=A0A6A3C082_HIBSY|nr:putative UDP-glucuronate:xylan alpha-glucuronosyltransferase 3 [Hibiscus syriacus]
MWGNSSGSVDTRHRLSSSIEASYKRRLNKNRVRGYGKPFEDRNLCRKCPIKPTTYRQRNPAGHWKHLIPDASHIVLHLDYADVNVTWDLLYPEWIDKDQEEKVPVCPSLPKILVPGRRLDLIAIKLPCGNEGNWSRDVARLHLQLAAATLATSAKGLYPVHMLFVSRCFPIPNVFTCKELVARENDVWLYKPDLNVLREKLQFPAGSCELALPFNVKATILHSAHIYVCGAIAVAQSIRLSGSTRDLVILVDKTISAYPRSGLEAAGWKIIFIDADMLILRNIDFLFAMPEISATGNNGVLFNSGVMVIEPSNCTFQLLMEHIDVFKSYNGGDQRYLNEIFTWWHRIPHMNFLKHFWIGDEEEVKRKNTRLFGSESPILYVLHYLGTKPWMCFKDYDSNWNVDIMQGFESDVAHEGGGTSTIRCRKYCDNSACYRRCKRRNSCLINSEPRKRTSVTDIGGSKLKMSV